MRALVGDSVLRGNLRDALAVHAVFDDEQAAGRRHQAAVMLSTAAVPEPVISTADHSRGSSAWIASSRCRASSCRSKYSLSRWHKSGCNRLRRTRSDSVTGPGLSSSINELRGRG